MSLYDEIARDIQNFAGVKCALKALCERVEAMEERLNAPVKVVEQMATAIKATEHMGGPLVIDPNDFGKRGPGRPRKIETVGA